MRAAYTGNRWRLQVDREWGLRCKGLDQVVDYGLHVQGEHKASIVVVRGGGRRGTEGTRPREKGEGKRA